MKKITLLLFTLSLVFCTALYAQTSEFNPSGGVFFNKRVFQENGYDPEYPYDLQKQGKWTWKTFEEMCEKMTKDTDKDGYIDQYAMSSFNSEFSVEALNSNGGMIIGRDKNGKFYNAAGSEKAMEAWNWIAHMFMLYQLPQEEANWDYFRTAFINGETAFMVDEWYTVYNVDFSSMKDDWGFVCFPLGPSGDGKYHSLANTKKIIDTHTEELPGYKDKGSWKDYYYTVVRDCRSVDETLQLMRDNQNPRFDTLIEGLFPGEMIWSICDGSGMFTPQEVYESCKDSWQLLIDNCNK